MNIRFFICILLLVPASLLSQPTGYGSGSIRQKLKKLNTLGSVMYVAAHPDDENTRLLTYLDNERNFRTVYLSVTRGDGGQNLIGKEQGAELGLIRTNELLEARKIDGAEQWFTRANDFGYSKNPEETFRIWGKEEILSDVVWAIRRFKPDVIITRFPATGEGGHGHHTASAILAKEAFKAAGDPKRFPEQLKFVEPWQAKRIFHNSFTPRGQAKPDYTGQLKLDVGGYNTLIGESYGVMASQSRSMHKSQGFGVASNRGEQFEYFRKLDGDTAVNEIFEGIATGWNRIKGGDEIAKLINKCQANFVDENPAASVPLLLQLLDAINKTEDIYWKEVKLAEVKELIAACAGLWYDANSSVFYSSPGDTLTITATAICRTYPGVVLESIIINNRDTSLNKTLKVNEAYSVSSQIKLEEKIPYSNPYWLQSANTNGIYSVSDQKLRGLPVNEPVSSVVFNFRIGNELVSYSKQLQYRHADPVKGEVYRPFEVVPAISVIPSTDILVFGDNSTRKFSVILEASSAPVNGKITFEVPAGFEIKPATADISIHQRGEEITKEFTITHLPGKTSSSSTAYLNIKFVSGNNIFDSETRRINYDHIPPVVHIRKSTVQLVMPSLNIITKKIGYIEGAGDEVARCLQEAGYDVVILDDHYLRSGNLDDFGAIVTGIRAYNTNEKLEQYYPKLMEYIESGGNLVVQYNTSNFISTVASKIGPYPFKISRDRVTEENAPVKFIHPGHPLLNTPNKITEKDFEGWVQERGLYFATDLAPEYETLLSWNDKDEKPLNNGLIITRKGKGNFIYTGISFFRQLPAGVPGAYRLLANLIDAGKNSSPKN